MVATEREPRYFRRVIQIKATDSPNVRLGLLAEQLGKQVPKGKEEVIPGVLGYAEYIKRRRTWDRVRATIGLDANFYEGGEVLLFPPTTLDYCESLFRGKAGYQQGQPLPREHGQGRCSRPGRARAMGIDPGEGAAKTVWVVVDEFGLLYMDSRPTPNTAEIPGYTLTLMRQHGIPPDKVCFDRGGGGKQHADTLRNMRSAEYPDGCRVRTVAFGESLSFDPVTRRRQIKEKRELKEDRYVYLNRRAQMYHEVSLLCDPLGFNTNGFCLPPDDISGTDLRQQLAVMPKLYDDEGRIFMLPKDKPSHTITGITSNKRTLVDMIGHSPDEADALVLAVYAMLHKDTTAATAGAGI